MMRRKNAISLLLVVFAVSLSVVIITRMNHGDDLTHFEPQTLAEKEWYTVSGEDESFEALLPFKSRRMDREMETEFGQVRVHGWSCVDEEGYCAYFVSQWDYSQDIAKQDSKSFFKGAIQRMLGSYQGKLISRKSITLDDYPGVEVLFDTHAANDDGVAWYRAYLVNQTLFQTLVLATKSHEPPAQQIEKFQKSFQLTKGKKER